MKIKIIGRKEAGNIIRGKLRIGQEVVIRHKGKIEVAVVVRTRRYTKTEVSYDEAAVMIKGGKSRTKGPISKGLVEEIKALSNKRI